MHVHTYFPYGFRFVVLQDSGFLFVTFSSFDDELAIVVGERRKDKGGLTSTDSESFLFFIFSLKRRAVSKRTSKEHF